MNENTTELLLVTGMFAIVCGAGLYAGNLYVAGAFAFASCLCLTFAMDSRRQ